MKLIGSLYFPDQEVHFQTYQDDIEGYQRPQREKAYEYVTNWKTAVDIGANVGIFSKDFSKRFARVYAIEPLPENIECLKVNLPDSVEIVQAAAGEKAGKFQMYRSRKTLGNALIYDHEDVEVPEIPKFDPNRLIEIDMMPLDDLDLQDVGLIKLDIQGSEVIALKGAQETIKRSKSVVLIEEKPLGNEKGSTAHIDEAADLLKSLGMEPREKVGADRIYAFP